ncbi:porin family protein [Halovulum dunhuangense]|uniref:Porin family protein n=1 Tax=Halovulum dunhuangense TaxID=1505036 RepID=A0A849L3R3_9RHOB|nr:outer membrane beta-barrel protein [Halovulum dunhuangense]NNU80969.1 porin family protein [Halovulum dunhuangense]
MKRILILTASTIGLAAPAMAGNLAPAPADTPVMAPAPVAAPAPMGSDWTGFYAGGNLGYGFGEATPGGDLDGVIGGLQAGYNYDLGNFVLGAEADLSLADLQVEGSADQIDTIARLKGRAGYDAGRTLFYLTGGAAYADGDVGGASASDWGWVAGAGMDIMLTDRWVGGVEYLYHKFDDFDGSGADIEANTIAARVNYRF